MLRVPYARAFNPVTKTNWEGVGVIPDIKVAADDALEAAKKDQANLATIMTSQRVLVFRSQAGSWSEFARRIHR